MDIPAWNIDFNSDKLVRLAENVCLQMKLKDSRWDRFLIDESKKKSLRFQRLQDMIVQAMKRASRPSERTTTAETMGTSLMED